MKTKQRLKIAGNSVPRVDAVEKVNGVARFTGDMELPGMAYAKILRSLVPHAKLVSIDTSKAESLPGVITVLSRDDLTDLNYHYGATYKDQSIVAVDKVRFVGDSIAAVLATDEAAAEQALAEIDVEYEELPTVTSIDEAIAPGAPLVHETESVKAELRGSKYGAPARFNGTNICYHFGYGRGDIEEGFKNSDYVFEDTFRFAKVQHYSLETHTSIAHFHAGKLTVWTACQDPFTLREHLAAIFKLPLSRVRVVVPLVGGAYGGKLYVKTEPIAAALSWKSGRPVKISLSVGESFKTVTRHPARIRIKTGVNKDGRLTTRECEIYMDTGAYADAGPRVTQKAGYRSFGPYRIPRTKVDAHGVYTNTVPAGAFRGFGAVQVTWAYESQMDLMAERMGMDRLEFRLKNLLKKGEAYTPGDTPVDCDLKEGLLKVAEALDWKRKPTSPNTGKGLSCCIKDGGGTYKVAESAVRMFADGSVVVETATVEVGQGSRTALSQEAAEELAVSLDRVSVAELDTNVTPYDVSTSASSSMTVMGLAVQRASQDVKKQLLRAGAKVLGVRADRLTLKNGKVCSPKGRALPYSQVILDYYGGGGGIVGRGVYRDKRSKKALLGSPTTFWEVGWGGAEVEVDPDTGVIRILKYVSASDVGKAINPLQCEGQDEGGVMMALGHTLFEEMVYEDGQLLNPNLIDYRVPTFGDLPESFSSHLIENGNGPGPFGSKGMGEGGVLPVASAIASAVSDAVGVRIQDLPLSPPKIWHALRAKEKAERKAEKAKGINPTGL